LIVNPEFWIEEEKLRTKIRKKKTTTALEIADVVEAWKPLSEFTIFKLFPPELRSKVWKIASQEPRLVEFSYYSKQGSIESKFPSRTTVPAVLHATREARGCALKIYEILDFGIHFNKTYINWELDVVIFEANKALRPFLDIENEIHNVLSGIPTNNTLNIPAVHSFIGQKCQNLAIHVQDMRYWSSRSLLQNDPKPLKKLILIRAPKKNEEQGCYTDGNLALAKILEGDTLGIDHLQREVKALQATRPRLAKDLEISFMDTVREEHRLMTDREKRARLAVKNGFMQASEAKALKEELDASMMARARLAREALEKEQKQKRYEDDLLLAAK